MSTGYKVLQGTNSLCKGCKVLQVGIGGINDNLWGHCKSILASKTISSTPFTINTSSISNHCLKLCYLIHNNLGALLIFYQWTYVYYLNKQVLWLFSSYFTLQFEDLMCWHTYQFARIDISCLSRSILWIFSTYFPNYF